MIKNKTPFSSMIRLFSLLIVITLLGACIFFIGVVNPSIPEGKIGVLYSIVHGYRLIPANKMFWSWRRFIPFGLKIYTFDNTVRSFNFALKGFLPQTDNLIRNFNFIREELTYTFEGKVQYFLKPNELKNLLALDYNYVKTGLTPFYTQENLKIQNHMQKLMHSDEKMWSKHENHTEFLLSSLNNMFTTLTFVSLTITNQGFPDLSSYKNAIEILNARHTAQLDLEKAISEQQIQISLDQQKRIDLLERYGKLLTKYPVLISFFAMDQKHVLSRDFFKDFFIPLIPVIPDAQLPPNPNIEKQNPLEPDGQFPQKTDIQEKKT